jgi:hypothetical protein
MRYIDSLAVSASTKRERSTPKQNHRTASVSSKYQQPTDHNSSPSKRMKIEATVPSSGRLFGDELSTNNVTEAYAKNDPKRIHTVGSNNETEGTFSDCGSEVTSVAQLRGLLQDFGQKNQHHYIKNVAAPSKEELEKPLRPKVRPSAKEKPGPTPLPKPSADALVRRMMENNGTASASTTPSIFRARATPVCIRIKTTPPENVQATNEGYASVAKLSKWLANDPTSTKKVKQLRRGANIIAKSRKFDKALANAEVEQIIPRNCVTQSKLLLQKALSGDDEEDDCVSLKSHQPTIKGVDHPDWMKLGTTASMSVAEKKKWLSSAFQTNEASTDDESVQKSFPIARARTEIASLRNSDIGSLAKEKWRKRTPTKPPAHVSTPKKVLPVEEEDASQVVATNDVTTKAQGSSTMETVKRHNGSSSFLNESDNSTVSSAVEKIHEQNEAVDFHLARQILVQRSKANGNDVELLSSFKLRKAKFESLEKEANRRKSTIGPTNILKTSWEKGETSDVAYVKKLKDDVAPKKTLKDLP